MFGRRSIAAGESKKAWPPSASAAGHSRRPARPNKGAHLLDQARRRVLAAEEVERYYVVDEEEEAFTWFFAWGLLTPKQLRSILEQLDDFYTSEAARRTELLREEHHARQLIPIECAIDEDQRQGQLRKVGRLVSTATAGAEAMIYDEHLIRHLLVRGIRQRRQILVARDAFVGSSSLVLEHEVVMIEYRARLGIEQEQVTSRQRIRSEFGHVQDSAEEQLYGFTLARWKGDRPTNLFGTQMSLVAPFGSNATRHSVYRIIASENIERALVVDEQEDAFRELLSTFAAMRHYSLVLPRREALTTISRTQATRRDTNIVFDTAARTVAAEEDHERRALQSFYAEWVIAVNRHVRTVIDSAALVEQFAALVVAKENRDRKGIAVKESESRRNLENRIRFIVAGLT